jgi:hypothetical protein
MLRSFMIISGKSGIVLFRKVFVKSLAQPRMIAGLVTALCNFSADALALPIAYMQLSTTAITVVSQPSTPSADHLRCVAFHDVDDGELYGRLIAEELVHAFMDEHSERLASLALANTEGVEDLFKSFNSRVRFALQNVVQPLMLQLNRERGIHRVLLLRHARTGDAFAHAPRELWYSGGRDGEASIVADVQALMHGTDDLLFARRDQAAVVLIGDCVRVERLSLATLVVATALPETTTSCGETIDAAAATLQRLFMLMPPKLSS